ncbi:MAG: hypothetical protein CSA50_00930 [Gammaproteobacteria bacterium]|nr:MAG: hypothetical protein CSA50_00930 [Gammaproteobacteria bacterium]
MTDDMSRTAGSMVDIGSTLRKAREARGFSIKEVADQLHLRPSIVQSLEVNDFSEISEDIFLKGYVKSYLILVGLPEKPVLTQLDRMLLERHAASQQQIEKVPEKRRGTSWLLPTMIAILLGVSAAGYMLFVTVPGLFSAEPIKVVDEADQDDVVPEKTKQGLPGQFASGPLPSSASETANASLSRLDRVGLDGAGKDKTVDGDVADPSDVAAAKALLRESDDINPVDLKTVVRPSDTDVEMPPPASLQISKPSDEISSTNPVSVVADISEEELNLASNEAPGSTMTAIESTLKQPIDTVYGEFDGDCWVQLKNGTGKTVIAGLKRNGDVMKYTGPGPLTIVVGDATVTRLKFNGEWVNFDDHRVWKKRAELTLGNM